jgi:hypothetical protein
MCPAEIDLFLHSDYQGLAHSSAYLSRLAPTGHNVSDNSGCLNLTLMQVFVQYGEAENFSVSAPLPATLVSDTHEHSWGFP